LQLGVRVPAGTLPFLTLRPVLVLTFHACSVGILQVYCWTYTGERQTQKFREKYVNAILSQEIGWFDTCGAGELSTRVAELCGKIQDGLGRKVGDSIQYIAQIVGSFAVAFYLSWRLTVVLIAAFPLIAGAGMRIS
jgi:ATP-binding cassette subfamily B (MDR/TAP) protein 1